MLRTLGSSLIAKAGVGSRTRELAENSMQNPNLPEKGQVGTISRDLVQDPLERPVPPGSDKIIAHQPLIESAALEPPTSPVEPNVTPPGFGAGIGIDGNRVAPSVPQGAAGQPLFQGGVSPAGTPASRAPQGVGGKVTGTTGGQAELATAYKPVESPNVSVQGGQGQQSNPGSAPLTGSVLGTKAYAGGGGENAPSVPSFERSGIRSIAGALSNATSAIPAISQPLRSFATNPANSDVLGNLLRSAISAPVKVGQSIANQVKSGGAIGQAINKLRSIFKF